MSTLDVWDTVASGTARWAARLAEGRRRRAARAAGASVWPARARAVRRSLLDLAGLGLLSYAAWLMAEPAGVAAAGLSLLLLSWSSERRTP